MSFNSKNQLKMDDFIKNTYKFGEICEVLNGRAYKKNELLESGKYTVLRVGNFFSSDHWYYSDLELDANKYCDNGDLLFAWSASFGPKIWDGGKVIYHYHIWKLVPSPFVDTKFLYYWLLFSRNKMLMGVHGSVMGHLTKSSFEKQKISLPDILEQKAIAHILSTLDDKIEVNNQINKTLENMAQTIFKQWFVDYEYPNENSEPYKTGGGEMIESELGLIPKGWVVGKLDDIATIVMGQSPKGTSYNEVGEGEVFYQGRTDFSSRFPIRRLFTTEPKRMANDGDVLMSVRAPVGDLNVANERCCIGRGLSAISSSADLSSYILYVMHDLRERLNVYNGEGTVFGSINQKDLKSIKVISSCDNKTEIAFDDLIQPIDRMIRNNEDETRRLINLRDRLLPKLLSGEIRVPLDEEGDAS